MKNVISIALIILAVVLCVMGYNAYADSSAGISIGDLEISAEDQGQQTTAIIYFGLGIAALVGGVLISRNK